MKKIVIIGAGYAGILTAKKLAKKLKKQKNNNVQVTIIDKRPFHTMLTELHEVAGGRVDEDSIKISLKKVFAGRKVNVELDTVKEIDFATKKIMGEENNYEYDYLVIAAGSKPRFYGVPGVEEYAHKLWSYEDAVLLKDHIHNTFRRASCTKDLNERKRLLTFYVIGAGFTGVEMAGELAEYVPILCEKYEISPSEVTMAMVDQLSRPIPSVPEKLSAKVTKRLNKMGVQLCLNTSVTQIGEDYIELTRDNQVEKRAVGTVIWVAGIQSSDITSLAADSLERQKGGRIQVDQYLRSSKDENVYVIGDNMYYVPEGEQTPVPQMVENCEQSADVAAKNIMSALTGKGDMEVYQPAFHGVMVCIGSRYGVAHVGLPGRFFSLPSFLAMFAKHFINIVYFMQVLGWNKAFSYMKHEFFTIRNRRSFVGGHFSNRTPSFLLAPLRLWLGAIWLYEGIMKIVAGWFNEPMLGSFFGSARSWYDGILNVAGSAGADVVSAATAATDGAAASAGEVIFNWNILGLFKMIFVSGTELATSGINDLAFKLDIPLMNWFVDQFILSNDQVQIMMQSSIVIVEILIGLALMGGLLTTVSAGVSLVLQFMFVATTGLYLGTVWMVFASIAVLIGGGRSFGLDYYAMPAIKRAWKRLPLVRRLYIYHD